MKLFLGPIACSLPVVDTWSAFQRLRPDDAWKALLSDGLHLSPSGQELLFELIMSAVQSAYPDALPDALPMHFPHHADIDDKDPIRSFSLP